MTTLLNAITEQIRNGQRAMSFCRNENTAYIGVFMTRSCLFNLAIEMTPGYNPPALLAKTAIKDIDGCPIFIIDSTVISKQPPEFTVAICDR